MKTRNPAHPSVVDVDARAYLWWQLWTFVIPSFVSIKYFDEVVVKCLRSEGGTTAAPACCTSGRIAGSVEFVVQFPDSTIPGL